MAGNFDWSKILGVLGGTGGAGLVSQMNPVTAGLAAVPAIYQLGKGIAQDVQAAKQAKSQVRPVMTTPAAQLQALYNAQNMADGQAPGISFAKQLMQQNQAASMGAVRDTGGGVVEKLANLQMLDQNSGNQALQLGQQEAQFQNQAQLNLQNQLMQLAQAQQDQFNYNKDEPYRNAMAASKELDNASAQNIQGGLTGLGGAIASAVGPLGENTATTPFTAKQLGFDPRSEGSTYNWDELQPDAKTPPFAKPSSRIGSGNDDYDFDALQAEIDAKGQKLPTSGAMSSLGRVKNANELPQRGLPTASPMLPDNSTTNPYGGGNPDLTSLTGDREISFPEGLGSTVNANTFGGAAGNIAKMLSKIGGGFNFKKKDDAQTQLTVPSISQDNSNYELLARQQAKPDLKAIQGVGMGKSRQKADLSNKVMSNLSESLSPHSDNAFVDAVLNPTKYPKLKGISPNLKSRSVAGVWQVYPSVVYDKASDLVVDYSSSPEKALEYALDSGDIAQFKTQKQANDFIEAYMKLNNR